MKNKAKGLLKTVSNVLDKAKDQGIDVIQNFAENSMDFADDVKHGIKKGAVDIIGKVDDVREKRALKKYNPMFKDKYSENYYSLPKVVMIIDDATSKYQNHIEQGSIGYKTTIKDLEVLNLYDETVQETGLIFVPMISLNTLYYADPHDENRYIQLDGFFDRMQESKLAELYNIAYSLGAKRYSVEMEEIKESVAGKKSKMKARGHISVEDMGGNFDSNFESTTNYTNRHVKQVVATAEFSGTMQPIRPLLKWYAQDDMINNLINTRCVAENRNMAKKYTISFKGNQYSSMSKTTAKNIDFAAKKLGAANFNSDIEKKATQEHKYSLVFHIEFD